MLRVIFNNNAQSRRGKCPCTTDTRSLSSINKPGGDFGSTKRLARRRGTSCSMSSLDLCVSLDFYASSLVFRFRFRRRVCYFDGRLFFGFRLHRAFSLSRALELSLSISDSDSLAQSFALLRVFPRVALFAGTPPATGKKSTSKTPRTLRTTSTERRKKPPGRNRNI